MYFCHHRKFYWIAEREVVEAGRMTICNYGQCRELSLDIDRMWWGSEDLGRLERGRNICVWKYGIKLVRGGLKQHNIIRELYSRAFENNWAGCEYCKYKEAPSNLNCLCAIMTPASGSMIISFPESGEFYIFSQLFTLDFSSFSAFWVFFFFNLSIPESVRHAWSIKLLNLETQQQFHPELPDRTYLLASTVPHCSYW